MKKLFAFLLVVVMILSMMVGCGNNTTPGSRSLSFLPVSPPRSSPSPSP